MPITGHAKTAGVVGWPVDHSRSPLLHAYWLARYGVDGAYVPLPVHPDNLATALRALPLLGFRGVNVTVPHKEAAIALCDTVDAQARRIGAVNTLAFDETGRIRGWNTDAPGFMANLGAGISGFDARRGPAVVLGAGGAARAVCAALVDAETPELRLLNRTIAKAERLAGDIGGPIRAMAWAETAAAEALAGAALLVNTTSLGMQGQPALDLDLSALPVEAVVTDIVYSPLETELLRRARSRGNPCVDGLGMLLHQAVGGFEAWFGVRPAVDGALRQAVLTG